MNNNKKLQAALELLTNYGFMIALVSIVLVILIYFLTIPNTVLPSQCNSFGSIYCTNIQYFSNSVSKNANVVIYLYNAGSSPVNVISVNVLIAGNTYYGPCTNSSPLYKGNTIAIPGANILCYVRISYQPSGKAVSGGFSLDAQSCNAGVGGFNALNCDFLQTNSSGTFLIYTGGRTISTYSTTVTTSIVPLSLDGSTGSTFSYSSTSGSVTLSTTNANDVIIVQVGSETTSSHGGPVYDTVSSITDTKGLSWFERSDVQLHPGGGSQTDWDDEEVWYAISSTKLTSDVITVHMTGTTDDAAIIAFGVSGANTLSPWDTNPSLPATAKDTFGFGGTATATVSTTSSNTMLLGFVGNDDWKNGGSQPTVVWSGSGGYSTINSQVNWGATNWWSAAAAYKIVSTPQSSIPITMTSSYSPYWLMIGDALRGS